MRRYSLMDEEIVDKYKLTKSDCDKFLQVIDLIANYKGKLSGFDSFAGKVNIPFHSINAFGITIEDIRRLSEILGNQRLFSVEKNNENTANELSMRVNLEPASLKHNIERWKKIAPEGKGVITLHLEGTTLKRLYEGKILTCGFEEEKYPLVLISKLMKSQIPLDRSELGEDNKNWSRTMKEVNARAVEDLELNRGEPLIDNKGDGYFITTKYSIR